MYYNGRLLGNYPLDQDSGLEIRDVAKAIAKYSSCDERNWPYIPSKFAQKPPDFAYTNAQKHGKIPIFSS